MRKIVNRVKLAGRIYEHDLKNKETGASSKAPGTPYIGGTISVATDDEGINIVTVSFPYVTAVTSTGKQNSTFTALQKIIDGGKTIVDNGMNEATLVGIDSAIGINDYYTEKAKTDTNPDGLVSAKRCEGGFVTILNKLPDEASRNAFECDMLITSTTLVEADEERHIENDYLKVKGATFNFRNALVPVEFYVKNPGGISYFQSLEASKDNLVFTKVWGSIKNQTIVIPTNNCEEVAFGEALVSERNRSVREWNIAGSAKSYEIGDEQNGITMEEIKKLNEDRTLYLADVKKRAEEYEASKTTNAKTTTFGAGATAATGSFTF